MNNIDELSKFAEELDIKVQEISGYLENCITKKDLDNRTNQIFGKLSTSLNNKFIEIYNNVSSEYDSSINTDMIMNKIGEKVYTKSQIDDKGYLTSHQSLDEYIKRTEVLNDYVRKDDLHVYMRCNCLTKEDLENKLNNYVDFKNLTSKLDDYYTKKEIDDKFKELSDEIPSLDSFVTKKEMTYIQGNIINHVKDKYLLKSDAEKLYLSSSYETVAEETFLKKSDFDSKGLITKDSIKDFVTNDNLKDYLLKSEAEDILSFVNDTNDSFDKLNAKINKVDANIKNTYVSKTEISKNFYTKEETKNIFLNKTDAKDVFLTQKAANVDYLTKNEAKYTYLAIEDYKSLKNLLTINDSYDKDTFNYMLKIGKLIDGIYIVDGNVYIVKNGKAYEGISKDTNPLNVYTKDEIDAFNFATQEWTINYVEDNCKAHKWIITNEY